MGKRDKQDDTIAKSSKAFDENNAKALREKLAFAEETIRNLQEQCSRMSKWASEIEANAEDKITELEAENAKLRGKIVKLVEAYV